MRDLFLLALFFVAFAVVYKFRARIFLALRRFDARNAMRRYEEARDRFDRYAHYKHTLRLAEEQVENVTAAATPDERTGLLVTRYLFLGQQYATRNEAEAVRRAVVMAKARDFYIELDKVWLGRRPPHYRAEEIGPSLPAPKPPDRTES